MENNNVTKLAEEFAELEKLLLEYNRIAADVMKIESDDVAILTDQIQD